MVGALCPENARTQHGHTNRNTHTHTHTCTHTHAHNTGTHAHNTTAQQELGRPVKDDAESTQDNLKHQKRVTFETVLHTAIRNNDHEALEGIVRTMNAGDINSADKGGQTALHYVATAAVPCSLAMARCLIQARADPSIKNSNNCTPVEEASYRCTFSDYVHQVHQELIKAVPMKAVQPTAPTPSQVPVMTLPKKPPPPPPKNPPMKAPPPAITTGPPKDQPMKTPPPLKELPVKAPPPALSQTTSQSNQYQEAITWRPLTQAQAEKMKTIRWMLRSTTKPIDLATADTQNQDALPQAAKTAAPLPPVTPKLQ